MNPKPEARCLKIHKRQGIYPHGWKSGRIQKILVKWANYKCENCGVSGTEVLLHVHHIRWHDKHDCRFENLVVVCVKCHTRIHNHQWQPGKEWKLSAKPDWQTIRGY